MAREAEEVDTAPAEEYGGLIDGEEEGIKVAGRFKYGV